MKRFYLSTLAALIALSAAACNPQPASPRTEPVQTTIPAPTAAAKSGWQQQWEQTLAAAKSEENVVIFTTFGESRDAIIKGFKEKHALEVDFVVGRERDLSVKVQSERRAGLYLEDIYLSGTSDMIQLRELGFLEPLKPALILPEVVDPKAWTNGELKFVDQEGLVLAYQEGAVGALLINTNLVKLDEIKSYKDLLDPKWKGKIVVMDPTVGGAGTSSFYYLYELMGLDFLRELGKQDLMITPDARQQTEWLARGKYWVSGNTSADIYSQFIQAGAPIKFILPVEGTGKTTSKGGVALLNKAPHPHAAKVFINWLLSKEGQDLMSRITAFPSRRLDASREWVDPFKIIQPGIRYIDGESEEAQLKKKEMQTLAKDLWNIKK